MADDDQMTVDERRKYLKRMRARYERADRGGQSQLLDEMEAVTGLHRKSLLRLLHAPSLERQPRVHQRGRTYGAEVERVVVQVWESLDCVCAERLTPALEETARHLASFGVLTLPDDVAAQVGQISEASVARLLARHRTEWLRLPRPGPERANSVTRDVPMRRIPWDTREPGHCEVDLVHHAGASSAGEYAHTLQLVDVATGWSERIALPNRGQAAMEAAVRSVCARLPFPLVELHPDNGREFFNWHLKRLFPELVPGLQLSRSRPYQKNDNRFVEQKNDSLVRQYVGYQRLDTPEQVAALDALYA
ncbi:MAG: integrase, partial [Ktedonobacterales bacterium]|nr:integrase [Ktedonobacterales bacterium]